MCVCVCVAPSCAPSVRHFSYCRATRRIVLPLSCAVSCVKVEMAVIEDPETIVISKEQFRSIVDLKKRSDILQIENDDVNERANLLREQMSEANRAFAEERRSLMDQQCRLEAELQTTLTQKNELDQSFAANTARFTRVDAEAKAAIIRLQKQLKDAEREKTQMQSLIRKQKQQLSSAEAALSQHELESVSPLEYEMAQHKIQQLDDELMTEKETARINEAKLAKMQISLQRLTAQVQEYSQRSVQEQTLCLRPELTPAPARPVINVSALLLHTVSQTATTRSQIYIYIIIIAEQFLAGVQQDGASACNQRPSGTQCAVCRAIIPSRLPTFHLSHGTCTSFAGVLLVHAGQNIASLFNT